MPEIKIDKYLVRIRPTNQNNFHIIISVTVCGNYFKTEHISYELRKRIGNKLECKLYN